MTIVEARLDHVRALAHVDTLAAEPDRIRLERADRIGEHRVQVAAMHEDIGEAVEIDRRLAEIEQLPGLAGAPQLDLLAGGDDLDRLQRFREAERMQHARAVGADLNAGADLLELRRLLVDLDVDAAAQQPERGREPADAAADDDDFSHSRKPSSP